jgi:Tfp pilus assembly protein PilE
VKKPDFSPTTDPRRFPRNPRAAFRGVAVVELMVALGILALVLMSSISAFLTSNRQAAAHRALTAARMIVERNIESVLAVSFDSTTTPAILATTSSSGQVYDDDGGGDSKVNILVQNSSGSNVLLKGTLTRIVVAEPNPQNATIRRITFRVTFALGGRNYSTQMTTLRAIDDF